MKSRLACFNTYLLLCLWMAVWLGCQVPAESDKHPRKEASTLMLYLEVNPDGSDKNAPVKIGKETSFTVNLRKEPFLTEVNIVGASVVDSIGGFQIAVEYDFEGQLLLEQYTTEYRGHRIGIMSQFGEARGLAAPILGKPITDGRMSFTPDATRAEAERIVRGLNNIAETKRKRHL